MDLNLADDPARIAVVPGDSQSSAFAPGGKASWAGQGWVMRMRQQARIPQQEYVKEKRKVGG